MTAQQLHSLCLLVFVDCVWWCFGFGWQATVFSGAMKEFNAHRTTTMVTHPASLMCQSVAVFGTSGEVYRSSDASAMRSQRLDGLP